MYFDRENGPEVEEDFVAALTLLHSTDDNSAEELRQILDALIEKKCGRSKTLAARRTCRDSFSLLSVTGTRRKNQEIKLPGQNQSTKTLRYLNIGEFPMNATFRTNVKAHALPSTAIITTKIGQKMANVLVAVDRTEIPTISIPDEGSSAGDGALCKICNGPRLGPLILLECQECQDVYHPLCHQPPVLDLDIYDPRLVWHCAKCVELSEAAAIVAAAGHEDKKYQTEYPGILKNDKELIKDETIGDHSKEHLNFFRRTKSRLSLHQETPTSEAMEQVFSDRNGSFKHAQTLALSSTSSSGLHLRKRVGSKLTVTRGAAK